MAMTQGQSVALQLTVNRAIGLARNYAKAPRVAQGAAQADGHRRRYHVAMGDAQASLGRVLSILAGYGLLACDGHLRSEVHLVCTGDYFDFGPFEDRVQSGEDGCALLAWLAAHPRDQVTILLGNHDLARLGELVRYDDESFQRAASDAYSLEHGSFASEDERRRAQIKFENANPDLPSFMYASRYYACFRQSQRELLTLLLREGRCGIAYAHGSKLLCSHAGVSQDQLTDLDPEPGMQVDAREAAETLNQSLFRAVALWRGEEALAIDRLHRVGNAARGPSGGIVSHRLCNPDALEPNSWLSRRQAGRLYDARKVPQFAQVCGHVRDEECIERFGPWSQHSKPQAGVLRSLAFRGDQGPVYQHGVATDARFFFIDGEMRNPSGDYQLLDLDRVVPLSPLPFGK